MYNLYALVPRGATVDANNIIKLIEPSIAGADVAPYQSPRTLPPKDCITLFSAKAGYVYGAWSGPSQDGTPYGQEPDTRSVMGEPTPANDLGPRFNRACFAAFATPESHVNSKLLFMVNEDNSIWKAPRPASYDVHRDDKSGVVILRTAGPLQPGTPFPTDPAKAGWTKMD